jgi:hypothetical protein
VTSPCTKSSSTERTTKSTHPELGEQAGKLLVEVTQRVLKRLERRGRGLAPVHRLNTHLHPMHQRVGVDVPRELHLPIPQQLPAKWIMGMCTWASGTSCTALATNGHWRVT